MPARDHTIAEQLETTRSSLTAKTFIDAGACPPGPPLTDVAPGPLIEVKDRQT